MFRILRYSFPVFRCLIWGFRRLSWVCKPSWFWCVQMFYWGFQTLVLDVLKVFVLCVQMFGVYQECCSLSPLLSCWPVWRHCSSGLSSKRIPSSTEVRHPPSLIDVITVHILMTSARVTCMYDRVCARIELQLTTQTRSYEWYNYWAIQTGLLTPLTFARHRLSPLAAFTSGAYFLHNGRRWQWIWQWIC